MAKGTMSFSVNFAKKHGLREAVFLNNVLFWLEKNAMDGKNIMDGRVWTYNTYKDYAALMPFFTARQVEYLINTLKEKGLILTENPEGYHRRTWITVADVSWLSDEVQEKISHFTKSGNAFHKNGDSISQNRGIESTKSGNVIPNEADSKPDINANPVRTRTKKSDSTLPPGFKDMSDSEKEQALAEIRRIKDDTWGQRGKGESSEDT